MAGFDIVLTNPGTGFDVDLLSGRIFRYDGSDWVPATVAWNDNPDGDGWSPITTDIKVWNGSSWVE